MAGWELTSLFAAIRSSTCGHLKIVQAQTRASTECPSPPDLRLDQRHLLNMEQGIPRELLTMVGG
jgi:hypothetical protein